MRVKVKSMKALAFMLCFMMCTSLFLCSQPVSANADAAEQNQEVAKEVEKKTVQEDTATEQKDTATEQKDAATEQKDTASDEKSVKETPNETDTESAEKADAKASEDNKNVVDPDTKNDVVKLFAPPALRAEQDNVITNIEALLQDGSAPVGDTITQWQIFRIKADFELPDKTVKAGDTTTIKLPEKLRFSQVVPFEVRAADGSVVANATVDGPNKTLTLTYTEYPESHSDVSGNFYFYVRMDRNLVDGEEDIPLDFTINNQIISAGTVHFDGYPTPQGGIVGKSGTQESTVSGSRAWFAINVNTKGEDLKDVSIVDTLKSKGITIKRDTLKIQKGKWEVIKGDYVFQNSTDVTSQYPANWNSDDSGFSISLGDVGPDEGYRITYYIDSDYELVDGENIDNNVVLHAKDIGELSFNAKITWLVAGGSAEGYVYKIRIKKVEKDNEQKVLSGAVFEVKRVANGEVVGTITTDANGEGELGGLLKDKYELTEITPPSGYELLDKSIIVDTADFNSDKIAAKTIENEPTIPETVEITVKKVWIGEAAQGAKIMLTRDGEEVETINVGTEDGWSHTFKDLLKTDPADGHDYIYDVVESGLEDSYITKKENPSDGEYIFTNTNKETVNIPVTKKWVGDPADNVRIKLTADNKVIDDVTLDASKDWSHTFTDLPVYDKDDGHKIEYDVQEDAVDGYISGRSGTVEDGFTFTNTITGKVSVPVTKVWNGPKLDSVTIDLLANGEKADSVILSKDNNWQHTFTDLDKYDNGKEIEYTVTEPKAENYKTEISGNAKEGFTITNTNTQTKDVNVTKKWVGNEADKITVRLYANGQETEKATLSKDTGWNYSFKGLPVYTKDGEKIKYSISEDNLDGYEAKISGDEDEGYIIMNTEKTKTTKKETNKEKTSPKKSVSKKTKPTDKGKTTAPKTGDVSNLFGGMILFVVSLGVLISVIMRRKKA